MTGNVSDRLDMVAWAMRDIAIHDADRLGTCRYISTLAPPSPSEKLTMLKVCAVSTDRPDD